MGEPPAKPPRMEKLQKGRENTNKPFLYAEDVFLQLQFDNNRGEDLKKRAYILIWTVLVILSACLGYNGPPQANECFFQEVATTSLAPPRNSSEVWRDYWMAPGVIPKDKTFTPQDAEALKRKAQAFGRTDLLKEYENHKFEPYSTNDFLENPNQEYFKGPDHDLMLGNTWFSWWFVKEVLACADEAWSHKLLRSVAVAFFPFVLGKCSALSRRCAETLALGVFYLIITAILSGLTVATLFSGQKTWGSESVNPGGLDRVLFGWIVGLSAFQLVVLTSVLAYAFFKYVFMKDGALDSWNPPDQDFMDKVGKQFVRIFLSATEKTVTIAEEQIKEFLIQDKELREPERLCSELHDKPGVVPCQGDVLGKRRTSMIATDERNQAAATYSVPQANVATQPGQAAAALSSVCERSRPAYKGAQPELSQACELHRRRDFLNFFRIKSTGDYALAIWINIVFAIACVLAFVGWVGWLQCIRVSDKTFPFALQENVCVPPWTYFPEAAMAGLLCMGIALWISVVVIVTDLEETFHFGLFLEWVFWFLRAIAEVTPFAIEQLLSGTEDTKKNWILIAAGAFTGGAAFICIISIFGKFSPRNKYGCLWGRTLAEWNTVQEYRSTNYPNAMGDREARNNHKRGVIPWADYLTRPVVATSKARAWRQGPSGAPPPASGDVMVEHADKTFWNTKKIGVGEWGWNIKTQTISKREKELRVPEGLLRMFEAYELWRAEKKLKRAQDVLNDGWTGEYEEEPYFEPELPDQGVVLPAPPPFTAYPFHAPGEGHLPPVTHPAQVYSSMSIPAPGVVYEGTPLMSNNMAFPGMMPPGLGGGFPPPGFPRM